MRKKHLLTKALTLVLSAAICAGGTGVQTFASSVQLSQEETENIADTATTVSANEGVSNAGEKAAADETEQTEALPDETTDATESEAETEDAETEDLAEETEELSGNDLDADGIVVTDSTKVSELIKDPELRKELLDIYNTEKSEELQEADFKYQHLKAIDIIDLSENNDAVKIQSVEGLGYASGATYIDISTTGITGIAESTFANTASDGVSNLQTVILPDALKTIGKSAFSGCNKLSAIWVRDKDGKRLDDRNRLPEGLQSRGVASGAFKGCKSLKQIDLNCKYGDVLIDATDLFAGCTSLQDVVVGKELTMLPVAVFMQAGDSASGMNVQFEDGSKLSVIEASAFQCANIESLDLSNCKSLARIGDCAFTRWKSLDANMSDLSKASAKYIKTLILPSETKGLTLGDELFFNTPVEEIYPDGTDATVEPGTIILPDYVTHLGRGAFYYASENVSKIQKVTLSAKMDGIGAYAFYKCANMETVTTSVDENGNSEITYIKNGAFSNTKKLTDGSFIGDMNQLKYIGETNSDPKKTYKYEDFKRLTYKDYKLQLDNNKGVLETNVHSDVFTDSGLENVVFPASLRKIGVAAFGQVKGTAAPLKTVEWKSEAKPQAAQEYVINAGAFIYNTGLKEFNYPQTAGDASFTIEDIAFNNCAALSSFIPAGVTNDAAFSKNSLPGSLVKLGENAFESCASLTVMHITNNGKEEAPVLSAAGFKGCTALQMVELPSALQAIPDEMFYDAPLIAFPSFANGNALEKIGTAAFFGNAMTTADLSGLTHLSQIGDYAFTYVDMRKNPITYASNFNTAPMKTMKLPASLSDLTLGNSAFQGAHNFDTMQIQGVESKDGIVVVPDYVRNNGVGGSLFSMTALKKVHWRFEDTGSANKWTKIPAGMFNATDVEKLDDVLPTDKASITEIGNLAFMGCAELTTLDLSVYPNLEEIGEAAFSNCSEVVSVKLPDNGKYTKVAKNTFRTGAYSEVKVVSYTLDEKGEPVADLKSSLKEIDFGGVTEIGEGAFASFSEVSIKAKLPFGSTEYEIVKNNDVYASALEVLDFSKTKVTKLGKAAFKGNYVNFTSLQMDGITEIGESAFERCDALVMTDTPMADSVETIGNKAFYQDKSLGKVTFGSGLLSIGTSAFEKCADIQQDDKTKAYSMTADTGLQEVDFTKAVKLAKIGSSAFKESGLKEFHMIEPVVAKLESGTLSSCPYLVEIDLGENLKEVASDAANGCIGLKRVNFSSLTTMDQNVFNSAGTFADADGNKFTPIAAAEGVDLNCNPADLLIAKGRLTKFPNYVSKYDRSKPNNKMYGIYIGNDSSPDDIYKYVKVTAMTDGYYIKDIKEDLRIENILQNDPSQYKKYYEATNNVSDMVYKTETGTEVLTFNVEGLENTSEPIPFTVATKFTFKANNVAYDKIIRSQYTLRVEDIPYHATLYTNSDRTKTENVTYDAATGKSTFAKTIRASKKNNSLNTTYYYDIQNVKSTTTRPDNCNLIIQSSNPDVVGINGAKQVEGTTNQWKLEANKYDLNNANSYAVTKGKNFTIAPKKSGDATITIWPEGCPQQTTTISYHITADINNINLSVPNQYNNGVHAGDSFNILDSVSMYLNQSVSKTKNDLANMALYTDNTIQFTSSNPGLVTVDQNGTVTIVAVPNTKETVEITATVNTPEGDQIVKSTKYNVCYPPLKGGSEMTDASGATVKITAAGNATTPGAVTYTKVAEGVTDVTIPETVVLDGVTCKVTEIDKGVFKNNKTIQNITIQAGIKSIPDEMFSGCSNLTSITLPNTIESIGKKAFMNCKKLKTVNLSSTAAVKKIDDNAFRNCSSLTKIVIPKPVTAIGNNAFQGCSKLKTVSFHKKAELLTIGNNVFSGCKVMKTITLPKKLTDIGSKSFYKCGKLKTIKIQSTALRTVGKNAFKGIYKKATIKVPKKKLGDYKTLLKGKGQPSKVKIKK